MTAIKSVTIQVNDKIDLEVTLAEARALKDALMELFPEKGDFTYPSGIRNPLDVVPPWKGGYPAGDGISYGESTPNSIGRCEFIPDGCIVDELKKDGHKVASVSLKDATEKVRQG